MKTKSTFIKNQNINSLVVGIIAMLFIIPIQAQVKRDHRTNKKEVKVRDHRVSKKAVVDNQTNNFDEGDVIFGTRTELQKKYPKLKLTGKDNQIIINKKLPDGENLIHKTELGTRIYANVKSGKIIELTSRNTKMKNVKGGTSNTLSDGSVRFFSNKNTAYSKGISTRNSNDGKIKDSTSNTLRDFDDRTCFYCRTFCFTDPLGNPIPCWTECETVDCSKDHTHEIPGTIVKGN